MNLKEVMFETYHDVDKNIIYVYLPANGIIKLVQQMRLYTNYLQHQTQPNQTELQLHQNAIQTQLGPQSNNVSNGQPFNQSNTSTSNIGNNSNASATTHVYEQLTSTPSSTPIPQNFGSFLENRNQKALLILFHLCHVMFFVKQGRIFDLKLIRLFKTLQITKQVSVLYLIYWLSHRNL